MRAMKEAGVVGETPILIASVVCWAALRARSTESRQYFVM